jgi:O-acetylserine/cysteine efflux transporter
MKPSDVVLCLAVQFLWALGFTVAKPALAHFPPLFMMAMTYGVTALCLARNLREIRTPFWTLFALASMVATIQAGLIFSGLARLPASTAVLVLQLQVPFSVLFAWPLAGERPTLARMVGTLLAFVGVVIVAGAPDTAAPWGPVALVTAGSAFWSAGQVVARRFGRDQGSALTAGIAAMAVPQMLLASLLLEAGQVGSVLTASFRDWLALAVFALAGFVAAYSIWYGLLRRFRIEQVIPFTLLMPVVGVVLGMVLLGESVSVGELVGGAVILAGLAVVVFAKERLRPSFEQAS